MALCPSGSRPASILDRVAGRRDAGGARGCAGTSSLVGVPPKSRPSTNGPMATTPPRARATRPSTRSSGPGGCRSRAVGHRARAPEGLVEQKPPLVGASANPGTGPARAQATSAKSGTGLRRRADSGRASTPGEGAGGTSSPVLGYTHARHSTGSRGQSSPTTEVDRDPILPHPQGRPDAPARSLALAAAQGAGSIGHPLGACWSTVGHGRWRWRSCSARARRRSTPSST